MEGRSEKESDVERFYCAGLFSADHESEEWVRCQKCLKGDTHCSCEMTERVLCVRETGVRKDRHLFTCIVVT